MSRQLTCSTAEIVVQTAEAVLVYGKAKVDDLVDYCDLGKKQIEDALSLAVDMEMMKVTGAEHECVGALTRFLQTPDVARKSAIIRIIIESYEPFVIFRQRLRETDSADQAAHQTKTLLGLTAHRAEIKDTLISLGTYAGALISKGGGRYTASDELIDQQIYSISQSANDESSAEVLVRLHIGKLADCLDRQDIILPLANSVLKYKSGDYRGSVADASRAVESFLAFIGTKKSVSLAGANGIGQKLDKLRAASVLPKKVVEAAKYIGQVRNAADHGTDVDPDVNSTWSIQATTAHHYSSVACSFIASALEHINNGKYIL